MNILSTLSNRLLSKEQLNVIKNSLNSDEGHITYDDTLLDIFTTALNETVLTCGYENDSNSILAANNSNINMFAEIFDNTDFDSIIESICGD